MTLNTTQTTVLIHCRAHTKIATDLQTSVAGIRANTSCTLVKLSDQNWLQNASLLTSTGCKNRNTHCHCCCKNDIINKVR